MVQPLFTYSPRILWGWRVFLLRLFGAQIGNQVCIHPTVHVFIPWNLKVGDWSSIGFDAVVYNLGLVTIGEKATISQRSHLCAGTHDYTDPTMPLVKSEITIGDEVWICADSFIAPGVIVGDRAILGARGVAVKDLQPRGIYAGNPAKYLKER